MKPVQIPEGMARPLALLIAINIIGPMVYNELVGWFYALWGNQHSMEAYIRVGYVVGALTLGVFFLLQYLNVRVALTYDDFRTGIYVLLLLNLLSFLPYFHLSVYFRLQYMLIKGAITLFFVGGF